VSLLRASKLEFGFYCIELVADQPGKHDQSEMAFIVGGTDGETLLSTMEQYDASSGQWSAAAVTGTNRQYSDACVTAGDIFITMTTGKCWQLQRSTRSRTTRGAS
jgi:hypothetical protein